MQILLTSTTTLNAGNCNCPSEANCFNFEVMEVYDLNDLLKLGDTIIVSNSSKYDHTLPTNFVVVEIYNYYRE